MSKSQKSFSKIEREKKREKKQKEKRKKKEERKASKEENSGIPFAYVDQFGALTNKPVEKNLKIAVDIDSIEISTPKKIKEEIDPVRRGKVSYFDIAKGYGFIIDSETQEKYFTHISSFVNDVTENDSVTFELEKGLKGMNAVRVTKTESPKE
ncbi:cold shock domain-containing protein [Leptobacterium sp. I13]|uniref:cold-shock protein n=1 Tax=Leptobacterium meishanense TaxID=3128904 RepID=UPI0030EC4C67